MEKEKQSLNKEKAFQKNQELTCFPSTSLQYIPKEGKKNHPRSYI